MSLTPAQVARVTPPVGTIWSIARNRALTTGAGQLGTQEIVVSTDRPGIWRQWSMLAGWPVPHGEVADESAMLALHTWDNDPTTTPEPRYVAPGDSCIRTDDPGWRWHCLRGHGTQLSDWERRPLAGALAGLAVAGHTHPISAITGLETALGEIATELDGKQAALANGAALARITADPGGAPKWDGGDWPGLSGGSGATLSSEILADSPTAYWKCSDASGNVTDSTAGARTLVVTGSPVRSYSRLVRGLADSHMRWTSAYASRADTLGVAVPWTGSWSLEFVVMFPAVIGSEQGVLGVGVSGAETEATNYQLYAAISTYRNPLLIWEYSAGANVEFRPEFVFPLGERHLVSWSKDAAAKLVRCYVDGCCLLEATYTQEPTGGAGAVTDLARNSAGGTSTGVLGHVALFYGVVLSPARVQAHAVAAGVM